MYWPASFSYDHAFLPSFAWFGSGGGKECLFLGSFIAGSSAFYLLLCLGLKRWSAKTRPGVWISLFSLYSIGIIIAAFNIADLSHAIPFPPLYILVALGTLAPGLLVAYGGYWLRLSDEVRRTVPLPAYARANLWLSLQSYYFFMVPLLVFRMPVFDHRQQQIYLAVPALMLLLYLAYLLLAPNLLRLLGLELAPEELPPASREALLAASAPVREAFGGRIRVAKCGLFNALAFPRYRTIVIGSDLLRILDPEELRAVLIHELGHLKDREFLPKVTRNAGLSVFLLWLSALCSDARVPGEPFVSLLVLLAGIFLVTRGSRPLRLKAEAFADRHVQQTDEALFPRLISALEKINLLNGTDRDFCKKNNYAHLDIDERVAAIDQGTLSPRPPRRLRPVLVFLLSMAVSIGFTLAYRHLVPSAQQHWKRLHNRYHEMVKADDDAAALQAITQALTLAENKLGRDTGWTSTSLSDLADFHRRRDDLVAAEEFARQALEVTTDAFGAEHERMIRCLTGLGKIRHAKGDLDSAGGLYAKALEIQTRLGKDADERASTMDRLFSIYRLRGAVEELTALHEQKIAMFAELGDEGRSKHHYAVLDFVQFLTESQSLATAERLVADAMSSARTVFGAESEEFTDALQAKAKVRSAQGAYADAVIACRECLDVLAKRFGGESEEFAYALYTLGEIQQQGRHLADAAATYAETLKINQKLYGIESNELAYDYWQLGLVNEAMGRWGEAERYVRKVAELEEATGDNSTESRIETHEKLLGILQVLGKTDEEQRVAARLQKLKNSVAE